MAEILTLRLPGWHHPMLEPFGEGSLVQTFGGALWMVVDTRPSEREIDLSEVSAGSHFVLERVGVEPPRSLPLPYEVVTR